LVFVFFELSPLGYLTFVGCEEKEKPKEDFDEEIQREKKEKRKNERMKKKE